MGWKKVNFYKYVDSGLKKEVYVQNCDMDKADEETVRKRRSEEYVRRHFDDNIEDIVIDRCKIELLAIA